MRSEVRVEERADERLERGVNRPTIDAGTVAAEGDAVRLEIRIGTRSGRRNAPLLPTVESTHIPGSNPRIGRRGVDRQEVVVDRGHHVDGDRDPPTSEHASKPGAESRVERDDRTDPRVDGASARPAGLRGAAAGSTAVRASSVLGALPRMRSSGPSPPGRTLRPPRRSRLLLRTNGRWRRSATGRRPPEAPTRRARGRGRTSNRSRGRSGPARPKDRSSRRRRQATHRSATRRRRGIRFRAKGSAIHA